MFETVRKCTPRKRNLACSMIMISENAAPMTFLQGNGSSVQLWEARVPGCFIPKNSSGLQHQHNQCECQSIAKRDIFELVLNILTHRFAVNIHTEDKFIPNFKIHKNLIWSTRNKLMHSPMLYIFQEKVNKTHVH